MELSHLLSDDSFISWVGGLVAFISTCAVGTAKWFIGRFDCHNERIAKIEREYVSKEDHDADLQEIYKKMDDGFNNLHRRFDELMKCMIKCDRS